jgi:hypothetical protein
MSYFTDNEGQIIIYTGLYRWSDGSIHEEKENVKEWNDSFTVCSDDVKETITVEVIIRDCKYCANVTANEDQICNLCRQK